jgi:glycosyltransferase involved in cell wall biosynthesis
MNIFINATSARLGGGLTVIRNLLPAMVAEDGGENRYTVVARDDVWEHLDPGHARVRFVTSEMGGRSAKTRFLWEQIELPLRVGLGRADVLLSPANLAVFGSPVPQVMIFQNMAPFDPDVVSRMAPAKRRRLILLRRLGIASASWVERVVFISDYAQRAIGAELRIDPNRTRRIHLGRDIAFRPEAAASAPALLNELGIRGRYLLSVSQFYGYKNFVELVLGFSRARESLPDDVILCIAGAEHEVDYVAQVRRMIKREGLESRVRLLGHVAYDKLPLLYAAASLFLFPSTCENFPNILVEGMASGVPTLASRLGPMPEIAGDGAVYFDPFEPDEIAEVIVRYWQDDAKRTALRDRGIQQSQRYSWNETARQLLEVLADAAHHPKLFPLAGANGNRLRGKPKPDGTRAATDEPPAGAT